jgi:hypothetical protein
MFKLKRAQMAITDLFIALFAFTILIVVIVFAWNRYALILGENSDYEEMKIIAFQTADLLVKSGGEPEDWEEYPDNVDIIGLASSDRNLSTDKVYALINNISYSNASRSLGVAYYNFSLQINHINGTRLEEYRQIPANRSVINVQRLVHYGNEKAVLQFALWRK